MRRGHNFSRAKSLKLNSTQIKITPGSSIDYLPYNSVRMEDAEGINHISAMNKNVPKRVSALSLNNQDTSKDEEIPLRSFNNLQNGDEKNYTVIE